MHKLSLVLVTLLLIVTSCAVEDSPVIKTGDESLLPRNHITMQTASKRLDKILSTISPRTRGFNNSIGEGMALGKDKKVLTRSGEEEAWYYYFPIDNGERFAIMSAKAELPDPNNLSSHVPDPIRWNIDAAIILNPDTNNTGFNTDTGNVVYGDIELVDQFVEPDHLCPVQWDQNMPYSMYCPHIPNNPADHVNAGCVPLAIAQFFAAEVCRPEGKDTLPLDWPLLYELGRKENTDVSYPKDGSYATYANPENIKRTLENYGFNGGRLVSFDEDFAIKELYRGYPVIMNGYPEYSYRGHTWIIHGVITGKRDVYIMYKNGRLEGPIGKQTFHFFNCNWGFGGGADGYYISSGFNPMANPEYNPDNNPPSPYGEDYSFGKTMQYGVNKLPE